MRGLLNAYQANITNRDPREHATVKMERVQSNEMRPGGKSARHFIEESRIAKIFLKLVGVFGVSLVMSGRVALLVLCFQCSPVSRWCSNTSSKRARRYSRVSGGFVRSLLRLQNQP